MRFEKVSFEQFKKDLKKFFADNMDFGEGEKFKEESITKAAKEIYDGIKLPQRSTKGSAGYDFFLPTGVHISSGKSELVPTGIRCIDMPFNCVLQIYPRSGLGAKHGLAIRNTVGIIDSDYAYSDNEGHIMIKLVNYGERAIVLSKGKAFCQGIFTKFYTTEDDNVVDERNGGFGSTDKVGANEK